MTAPKPDNRTDRQRIVDLETKVAALETALGLDYAPPPTWGLTPTEGRILGMLKRAPILSRERVMAALYGHMPNPPEDKTVNVLICKLRRKLRPMGVTVNTSWGSGWWFSREGRLALQRAEALDTH